MVEKDDPGEGAVYILFMNSNGTVKSQVKVSDGIGGFTPSSLDGGTGFAGRRDRFGSSVANLGDIDGDGIVDLAVGADGDENGTEAEGAVYILLMNSDGTVKGHTKISDGLGGLEPGTLVSEDENTFRIFIDRLR